MGTGAQPAWFLHVSSPMTVIGYFCTAFPKAQLEGKQTGCSIHQKGSLRAPGRLIPPHCKPRSSKVHWDCSKLWVISGFVLYHTLVYKKFLSLPDNHPCGKKPKTALRLPAAQPARGLLPSAPVLACAQGPCAPRWQGRAPAARNFLQPDTKFIFTVCKIHPCARTPW